MNARFKTELTSLVDDYRIRCLWFLKIDYYPQCEQEIRNTLNYIRRYGDSEAFRRTGILLQWLSQDSSTKSVVL
jgi:hypothetical protein